MAVRPLDESSVEKKLRSLTNTQESIQSLSLWIIHHKAHHEKIVELWFKAMKKADYAQRLTLLYLCNDIVQTCKRKHAIVYKDAFKEVLKDVALLISDGSVRHKVERIFGIWLERNVYDQTFTDELVAILNNTQVKTTVSCKLLSEFKPEVLIDKVNRFKLLTTDVELKRRQLVVLSLDASRVDAVQQLKDRAHGHEFSRQFEESCQKLDDYVHFLEVEIKDRADLIEMLEQSEIYYDAQYGEAKIVANAYKNFGTRVNNLRKKLTDYAKTLPDTGTTSPVPSPSMDAPSPGNTPPEEEPEQECDNRETVDMELSDEDGDGVTLQGTASKRQHLSAAGTSPRLEDGTASSSLSPGHTNDADLDLFKLLPTLSKGARSSFFSGSSTSLESVTQGKSQLDPRQNNTKSMHPNVVWNATHGFTTSTEGDMTSDKDPVATVNEGNLLQLTEGDSTPVKDEGCSTPVMDEKPDEAVANPIEFLTQLISQGKKGVDGTASSFMQSLSALTSNVNSQMSGDSGGSPMTDTTESTADTAPNSWAAWKAKQEPPAPAENGTQSQDQQQAAPPVAQRMQQPIPPPVAPPVTFSRPMAPQFPRPQSQPGVPPNYRPTAGSYEHMLPPLSTPQPVPPPPQMPIFPQPVPPPAAGMWHPVRPPIFSPSSHQPPPHPSGVVSPTEPMPSGPGSQPHLVMPTAPGGSAPPTFNAFPSPDSAGQTSPGVSIPTVGGAQPQRPQFPPPPPQPPSPFGAPTPTTPSHVTSPTALEEEQNEFIRKLKRKTGMATIPTTPPTPPVGILKSSANSNLRTLTQVQEEAGDGGATQPEMSAASDMGGGQMDLGSSIQTIQSVHVANNSKQFGSDDRMAGAQNSGYRQGQHRQPYNAASMQYGQYRDDHEPRGAYRREGYRRGFERDAFHRDSYGRLPPKRPPPKFEPGGYYQRY